MVLCAGQRGRFSSPKVDSECQNSKIIHHVVICFKDLPKLNLLKKHFADKPSGCIIGLLLDHSRSVACPYVSKRFPCGINKSEYYTGAFNL